MEGLLLGLANGTVCLSYCAPVLVPYIVGSGEPLGRNFKALGAFLIGRLGGYLLFAVLAWLFHRFILEQLPGREVIVGAAYVLLAAVLILYGLSASAPRRKLCPASTAGPLSQTVLARVPSLLPLVLGFLTGLNVCPPFLLALAKGSQYGQLAQTLFFFTSFFVGTSVFLLPVPFLGGLARFTALQTVARLSALVAGVYFTYLGSVLLIGGMIQL